MANVAQCLQDENQIIINNLYGFVIIDAKPQIIKKLSGMVGLMRKMNLKILILKKTILLFQHL